MAQLSVTDVPVHTSPQGSGTLVIQNLSATINVYADYTSAVTASGPTGGIRIGPGLSTEWEIVTQGAAASGPWLVCAAGQSAVVAYLVFQD